MDISIIIPVYNVEEYIERCILSVCKQSMNNISVECILVNDNSPDKSIDKAKSLIESYSGEIMFKIVTHDQNQGLSSARNTGMKNATGKYLFFLDSDDFLEDMCIQELWNIVVNNPKVQMVMGNYQYVCSGVRGIDETRIPHGIISNYQLMEFFFIGAIPVVVWNSMVLREIVVDYNLSFKSGLLNEDVLWSFHLLCHIDTFYFLRKITLNYETNPKSITNYLSNNRLCYLKHRIVIIDDLMNSFCKNHIVANTLYILSNMLTALDIIWGKEILVEESEALKIYEYRKKLFRMTLKSKRFVLVLFELLMYKPVGSVMKIRLFRNKFDAINLFVYRVAKFFDFLHLE